MAREDYLAPIDVADESEVDERLRAVYREWREMAE